MSKREIRFLSTTTGPTSVPLEPNLNLLAHAQLLELDTGSQCGGHGKCGMDRVHVDLEVQKRCLNQPTQDEHARLSPEQLKSGVRLACQAFPNPNSDSFEVKLLRGAKAQI